MQRRFFDRDELTGITQFYHYDASNDTFLIEDVQDIEGIVENNKRRFNEFTSGKDRWGDEFDERTHVARIPMVVYQELLTSGAYRDRAYMKRWLNDPDNAVFRTRPGRV